MNHAQPSGCTAPGSRSRRRIMGACLSLVGALMTGCASLFSADGPAPAAETLSCAAATDDPTFDFVVVGSGAGGGPLAANLARAGFKVLLLEAGGDEDSYEYEVPAFHALASEDDRYAWNFFVRHYADTSRQARDPKFDAARDGVLYPRCATLGGCTAHNAMILVYPHNSDWDRIAEMTGDASWGSERMRRYFERLERCEYASADARGARHGFSGWLSVNVADPLLMVRDRFLKALVRASVHESLGTSARPLTNIVRALADHFDPNDWRSIRAGDEGVCLTPLSTKEGRRVGAREYIRRVQAACPDRLVVRTHALASRVLLDANKRATGVEYLEGAHLYRADPRAVASAAARTVTVSARREVILCAGAFNTPQLLKLSGVGPRRELAKLGIPLRVDLPGVGENLQDRYEVAVVSRMRGPFTLTEGMRFRPPRDGEAPDPQFRDWLVGRGPYTTNGAVVSLVKRSRPDRVDPDLFIFGLLGSFKGYFSGYSAQIAQGGDMFTWAILKAHNSNTAGRVTLRSKNPRDVPHIDFASFSAASDAADDLDAVAKGVEIVRSINARCDDVIAEEIVPGHAVASADAVRSFIRDNAWGHHASCTCRIGAANDPMAVLDSRFRVRGVKGLRVVDASIFPRIPGFFPVAAIYVAGEKASDVIIEDARADTAPEGEAVTSARA